MSNPDQLKWDRRYENADKEPRAATVLKDNLQLLPTTGTALDLACGLGGNALLLAEQGLQTEAWDISPVAIEKLAERAKGLPLVAKVVDISSDTLPANTFDVIVVSYYLDRELAPAIIKALKSGGRLFYQTFNHIQLGRGPANPAYRLQEKELLELFSKLRIRYYREDESTDSSPDAIRDEAMLVAQKV